MLIQNEGVTCTWLTQTCWFLREFVAGGLGSVFLRRHQTPMLCILCILCIRHVDCWWFLPVSACFCSCFCASVRFSRRTCCWWPRSFRCIRTPWSAERCRTTSPATWHSWHSWLLVEKKTITIWFRCLELYECFWHRNCNVNCIQANWQDFCTNSPHKIAIRMLIDSFQIVWHWHDLQKWRESTTWVCSN